MISKEKRREYNRTFYDKHPSYWHKYKEKKDAYMKEYYQRPEVKLKHREYQLRYKRQHYLSTKTGRIRVDKRLYPSDQCCEVCGVNHKRLMYHHWDDADPSKGVWVCYLCHQLSEGIDRGLVPKYLGLKQLIEGSN